MTHNVFWVYVQENGDFFEPKEGYSSATVVMDNEVTIYEMSLLEPTLGKTVSELQEIAHKIYEAHEFDNLLKTDYHMEMCKLVLIHHGIFNPEKDKIEFVTI